MPKELCCKYSKMIEDKLISSNLYKEADTLLIYASYRSEVSTYGIIKQAFKDSKKVFCPKVLSPGIMEFYEIHSLDEIICGYKNIPEPPSTNLSFEQHKSYNTLMAMPLVAYDSAKTRIGYGGGFYDRYLQTHTVTHTIALGFECQRYESAIPYEDTDIKPEFILTETNYF